ncbi:HWE histidine kinase domain-containing protein [Phenylobacterium aquaticum]|uniref:HWE histidine kinase domain-containing protein n=1 Tax=Phenylobacterium aquaticum TaxID=1763816 RepID=UPI0026EC855B|nr:HWE histidine kinase domain-containing protein [Phenylobacterium aquaticum]
MPSSAVDHRLEAKRLELALNAARLGEFEWDMQRDLLITSARMAAITGVSPGTVPADGGKTLFSYIHPDDRAAVQLEVETALRKEGRYEVEYRLAPGPGRRSLWLKSSGDLVRDEAGKPCAVCGVVQDITERKTEEDQRQTLMAELDHRVKNVLAAVQTLAQQTARRTTSLESFLTTFAGRLKSMASANELLTAARWRGAAIAHLAAAELGGIAPGQTRWDGPELFLTPRAANALSLALHELATNALKFGALSTEHGRVYLRWVRRPENGFELTWTETGGPTVQAPKHLGFGSTLLEQVTGRELNGEVKIEYPASGVRVRLSAGDQAVVERPDTVPNAPVPRAAVLAPVDAEDADLRGARVLIVEDAVLLAMELETGLSDAGASVIGPAYELEEAMALLDQPIDAAVLDANLNGRSVMPVAEVLAARGVPFVFATGYGDTGGAPGGFDAPIIRKPYDVSQVAAAVAGLLRAR